MRRFTVAFAAACLACCTAVHGGEIRLGMSAVFSGPSRSLGMELYRGSLAYLESVNRAGGVHGNRIVIVALDDAYDPNRTVRNTVRLIEEEGAFLLFNYVGTPTVTRMLPLLKHYAADHFYLFFPFTGAEPQRRPPYSELVFNLRASYHQETAALVDWFEKLGHNRIAVLHQADSFGRGGWEGVRHALRDRGLDIHSEATYRRGAGFNSHFGEQVRILRDTAPDAVVAVCAYAACAAFVREARDAGWDVPVASLSFSGSEALLDLLTRAGTRSGRDYTRGMINAQVVPSYESAELAGVLEYRRAMDELGPALPPTGRSEAYDPMPYSFASLEGFLNAKLLVRMLETMGPDPVRAEILRAAEGLENVDLGIDAPVGFGPGRHQALQQVYLTRISDGRFVPLEVGRAWRKDSR